MKVTGVPIIVDIPQHGHSNADNGGVLKMSACSVYKTINQVILPLTGAYLSFNAEDYDSLNLHDIVTNNTRFTIPFGYNFARIMATISFSAQVPDAPGYWAIVTFKNTIPVQRTNKLSRTSATIGGLCEPYITRYISVAEGDYLELYLLNYNSGGQNFTVSAIDTNVVVEVYR